MIRLFQFPPAMGLPNASGFCLKLETWLRMADFITLAGKLEEQLARLG